MINLCLFQISQSLFLFVSNLPEKSTIYFNVHSLCLNVRRQILGSLFQNTHFLLSHQPQCDGTGKQYPESLLFSTNKNDIIPFTKLEKIPIRTEQSVFPSKQFDPGDIFNGWTSKHFSIPRLIVSYLPCQELFYQRHCRSTRNELNFVCKKRRLKGKKSISSYLK